MIASALAVACVPLVAHVLDRVPGIVLGLPLLVVAALVFAATRHEDPAVITRVGLSWLGWLCGVLGGVLAAVVGLAWLS